MRWLRSYLPQPSANLTCAKPASAACSSPACIRASPTFCPTRLGFYENWLNAEGLRDGTIGLAPLYAVLSFLRQEGEAYQLITTRAGEYAAEWTVESMPPARSAR